MGQYWMAACPEMGEYMNPREYESGRKQMEFAYPETPFMLAYPGRGGGGDYGYPKHPWYGAWAGDTVAVVEMSEIPLDYKDVTYQVSFSRWPLIATGSGLLW